MRKPNNKSVTVSAVHPVAVASAGAMKPVDTGEDLFLIVGKEKHQFSSQISAIYAVKEFLWKGNFEKGADIKIVRGSGSEVPVHHSANCGYTLVGKAQQFFTAGKALCANGEASDDQEYVYVNEHSVITYSGETGVHTVYVRIYDNLSGIINDRWVVISLD
jgi:hypothetical protein